MNEGGHCGKCGAPYFVPNVWHGVLPPPVSPTCACWNVPAMTVGTGTSTVGDANQAFFKMVERDDDEDDADLQLA